MEDTVEQKIEGVAEQIIAEDAERRAQDLVRRITRFIRWFTNFLIYRISSI